MRCVAHSTVEYRVLERSSLPPRLKEVKPCAKDEAGRGSAEDVPIKAGIRG